jgi:hypothetical protein
MLTHRNLSTMMFVAILALPIAAEGQTTASPPTDSAAVDSAVPQSKMQKLGGLFGKAKKLAGNKNVQAAAKGVACTAVPGAAAAGAAGKGPCDTNPVATLLQNGTVKGAVSGAANGAVAGALGQNAAAAALVNDATNARTAVGTLGGLSNAAKTTAATAIMGTGDASAVSDAAAKLGNAGSAVSAAKNGGSRSKGAAGLAKGAAPATAGTRGSNGKSAGGGKAGSDSASSKGMSNAAAVSAIEQMLKDAGTAINNANQPVAKAAPKTSVKTPAKAAAPSTAGAPPVMTVNANYDFVAGDQPLFSIDYSEDRVGNFPKKLGFVEGNMEIVEAGNTRLMRITTPSVFTIPLPESLPQKFTIEMEVINRPSIDGWTFQLRGGPPVASGDLGTTAIDWGSDGVAVLGGGGGEVKFSADDATRERYRGKPVQLRVMGDGDYIKVYLDQRRLANIPNAQFARTKVLTLRIDARSEDNPAFIGKIRIAGGR